MAIQPIDLQALFSQLDKVGKTQSMIRDGQQIHDSLQQNQIQRKLEDNVRSVNEAQDMGEEPAKIMEDKGRGTHYKGAGKGKEEDTEETTESYITPEYFKDPSLGKNIDISG